MSRSVLLIEDNEQNRYLVTFLLEQSGYTVTAFADGARGIEAARTMVPHLVLLDIQLPDVNGFAVCERLVGTGSAAPVVVLTSTREASSYRRRLDASGA